MKKDILVGGQAVIEGVMMRAPGRIAMAVRKENGDIQVEGEDFISLSERKPFFRLPVMRGIATFFEMLVIGFRYLNLSAEISIDEASGTNSDVQKKKDGFTDSLKSIFPIAVALAVALLFFMFIPLKIADLAGTRSNGLSFNIIAGFVRLVFFVAYLLAIRMSSEIKRIFMYHGAEHKVVFSYEAGKPLSVESARPYATLHPRCGTSFIMVVIVLAILFYGLVDALVITFIGAPTAPVRLVYHLFLLPLVGGLSYEVIRAAGKKDDSLLFKAAVAPGLLLQKITTAPPDDGMLEVAVESLKEALRTGTGKTSFILEKETGVNDG